MIVVNPEIPVDLSSAQEVISGRALPWLFYLQSASNTTISASNTTIGYATGKITTLFGLDFNGIIYPDSSYRTSWAYSNFGSPITFTPWARTINFSVSDNGQDSWPVVPTVVTRTNVSLQSRYLYMSKTKDNYTWSIAISLERVRTITWSGQISISQDYSTIVTVKSLNPDNLTVTTHGTKTVWPNSNTYTTTNSATEFDIVNVPITTWLIDWNILYIEVEFQLSSITLSFGNPVMNSFNVATMTYTLWSTTQDKSSILNQIYA